MLMNRLSALEANMTLHACYLQLPLVEQCPTHACPGYCPWGAYLLVGQHADFFVLRARTRHATSYISRG